MVDKINMSSDGTKSIESDQDKSEQQYVTTEQLNLAINGFRKSFKKDLESILASQVTAPSSKEEVLETGVVRPTVKSLDLEKEEMKKQLKILLDDKAQTAAEMAEQRLNSTLRDNFTKHGIDPRHVEHAIAYAKHNKIVKHDEDGNLVMKVNQIDMPLQDAMPYWVKTEDAKLYLAPRGTKGSGQNGPVRAPSTNAPPAITQDNIGDMLMDAIRTQ